MPKRLKPKEINQDINTTVDHLSKGQPAAPDLPEENNFEDPNELTGEQPQQDFEPDITVFRPDREGVRKVLGDLEADVMEFIWDTVNPARQWLTVRDVYEDFRLRRSIAYTTVMSTMARLGRKHLLQARKVDGAFVYTPSLNKEEFIDNFVARILENLLVSFSNSTEEYLNRVENDRHSSRIAALKTKMATLRQSQNASQGFPEGHGPQSPAPSVSRGHSEG